MFAPGELEVLHFPDWETLPYDHFSPHEDIISERLNTLYTLKRLPRNQASIILVSLNTVMQRLCPTSFVDGQALVIQIGEDIDLKAFRDSRVDAGYQVVNTVYEHGEFAIRGNIIDIFLPDKQLREQIMKIKTDTSPPEAPKDPDTSSLFGIYRAFADADATAAMRRRYAEGISWGEMKQVLL